MPQRRILRHNSWKKQMNIKVFILKLWIWCFRIRVKTRSPMMPIWVSMMRRTLKASVRWAVPRVRGWRELLILEMMMVGRSCLEVWGKDRTLTWWKRWSEESARAEDSGRQARQRTWFQHFWRKSVRSARNSTAWTASTTAQDAREQHASYVWITFAIPRPQNNTISVQIASSMQAWPRDTLNAQKLDFSEFCTENKRIDWKDKYWYSNLYINKLRMF